MKINEIINEDYDGSKNPPANNDAPPEGIHPDHQSVQQGITKMRDVGGYDRVYHLNRISMAAAMHDGKSSNAVDMPSSSWIEKYNTAHPYTEEEHKMMLGAFKTVPSDTEVVQKWSKSMEPSDTHKVSPHPAKKKNKYGV
jgi:hypothetical protein